MVVVLGTSGCYMLNTEQDEQVEGMLGKVQGGIFPGPSFGYEMGQSSCGDAFAWLASITGQDIRSMSASVRPLDSYNVNTLPLALDWFVTIFIALIQNELCTFFIFCCCCQNNHSRFNGCRSPHNNSSLTSMISGLTMNTSSKDMYLAILAGVICGGRSIVSAFSAANLSISQIVLTGGLPHAIPFLPQVCFELFSDFLFHILFSFVIAQNMPTAFQMIADTNDIPVSVAPPNHAGSVRGAAVMGAVAADLFPNIAVAVEKMSPKHDDASRTFVVNPSTVTATKAFHRHLFSRYQELVQFELSRSSKL